MIPSHCWRKMDRREFDAPVQKASGGRQAPRFSDSQVRQIRQLRAEGHTIREIAQRFGIADAIASNICTRKAYARVA